MKDIDHKGWGRSPLALSIAALCGTLTVGADTAIAQVLEEVTVTGSRIRQTDGMRMPTPVTAVTTEELSVFDPGGTVAEQLDALPQFFGNSTAQRGGGTLFDTAGGSYLDMRDLGRQRTLVLFDGARMVPADKRGSVNVDTLPTALVRSIDVVTGGASAAYGADALGGVTNFVLDRQFQGLRVNVGTGTSEWGDGDRWNFSVAGGTQIGERLNLIGSVEARQIDQINRNPEELGSWWQRWGWVTNPEWSPGAPPGVPQRLTLPWVTSSEHSPTGVIWARAGSNSSSPLIPFRMNGTTFLEDGSGVREFIQGDVYAAPNRPGSTKSMSGGPEARIHNRAFGGGPSGQEVVNRSGFVAAQYAFTDNLRGFAQILVGRSESNSVTERGGYSLQDGWYATVYRENAFLPASVAAAMDEAGIDSFQLHKLGAFLDVPEIGQGRKNRGVFTTQSWTLGLDAVLPNGWDLRASWQSGESHKRTGVHDEIRVDRVFLAMDAVVDPATGAIVCNVQLYDPTPEQLRESVAGRLASPGGSPGGTGNHLTTDPLLSPIGLDNSVRDCVPFNAMGNGNISHAALDYVTTVKMGDSYVDQDFGEVLVTGELHDGWGHGPVSLAAGINYREQSFSDVALPREIDVLGPPLNAEHLGIRGIPPGYAGGSANLHQFSTVPHVSGEYDVWEWFGEVNLPFWEAASDAQSLDGSLAYRSSDYSNIGRVESWKLGLDVRVFEPLRVRATKSRDVREATFAERFDQQGSGGTINDPRFNNTSFQITSVAGGNPDLAPEEANTVVAGFVYQPTRLPGFQASADWYRVEIDGAVAQLGLQRVVDECELRGNTQFCTQIERDPATGFIGRVWNVYQNVAEAKVEGVDFEVLYRIEPNFSDSQAESLSLRLLGGYVLERSDTPLGGVPRDVAGQLGSPEFTAIATLSYNIGAYGIQLQQRYIDETIRNIDWVEGVDVDDNRVSSGNYTNLRLAYNGATGAGAAWSVALNVTNLFDRPPPIVASYGTRGGSQLIPNGYDEFGRRYQLSMNYSF